MPKKIYTNRVIPGQSTCVHCHLTTTTLPTWHGSIKTSLLGWENDEAILHLRSVYLLTSHHHSQLTSSQHFWTQLHDHLLARTCGLAYDSDEHKFSDADRNCVNIKDNKLYFHSTLHVNYTMYDLRCKQDTISPQR